MDVKYINPFLDGAVEVLRVMTGVDLQPQQPFVKQNAKAIGDVSGVIGLSGEVSGSLAVSFSYEVVRQVMRTMLGVVISGIDDQVTDAVGELTNMISGQARQGLAQSGLSLRADIPNVRAGHDHVIPHRVRGRVLAIPFESDHGQVVVEVCLDS